jgi:hypothetical protein
MRAVTSATAAAVLQLDRKAFDNLLQRLGESTAPKGRQGVERRIGLAQLEELFLTAELCTHLGLSARDAFRLAQSIIGTDSPGQLRIGTLIRLEMDLPALRAELRRRYEVAVESIVRPRRGRPPRRTI